MTWKTIGIIGGLGPHATIELERRLIARIPAKKDQDYPTILSFNNPKAPDRSRALAGDGETPVPELARTAHALARAGAQVLCMPCNTAHAYYQDVAKRTPFAVFVHMVEETAARVARDLPACRTVGVLCTTGTRQAEIYDRAFAAIGINTIYPSSTNQSLVMEATYGPGGLKSGGREVPTRHLERVAHELLTQKPDALILACTELSLMKLEMSVPVFDAMDALVDAVLREAAISY